MKVTIEDGYKAAELAEARPAADDAILPERLRREPDDGSRVPCPEAESFACLFHVPKFP